MRTRQSHEPRPAADAPARSRLRGGLLALALAAAAQAQAGAYRWTDADGRVVYGDRPPAADARPLRVVADDPAASTGTQPLPYALRTVAARRPVTLYTIRDCTPCEAAREHLARRGVPFSERTLARDADVAAFRALGFGELRLPAIAIGAERSQPFAPHAWDLLLDAAGYPKQSMLPRGWRAAPARPLASELAPAANESASRDPDDAGEQAHAQDGAAQDASPAALPERAYARPESVRRAAPAMAPAIAPAEPPPAAGSIRF